MNITEQHAEQNSNKTITLSLFYHKNFISNPYASATKEQPWCIHTHSWDENNNKNPKDLNNLLNS